MFLAYFFHIIENSKLWRIVDNKQMQSFSIFFCVPIPLVFLPPFLISSASIEQSQCKYSAFGHSVKRMIGILVTSFLMNSNRVPITYVIESVHMTWNKAVVRYVPDEHKVTPDCQIWRHSFCHWINSKSWKTERN